MPKPKRKAYMGDLLRCVTEIVQIARQAGEKEVIDCLNKEIVMNADDTRRLLISIILDEVCRHFCVTQEHLTESPKHLYDIPRMITYYLLYEHGGCTQKDVSLIFSKQEVWVHKKITEFKKLDNTLKTDITILDSYNCIFNKFIARTATIQ